MKRKDYIITSIFVIAIIALATICGGYFIYNASHSNIFAKGTSIGGIDVSGLDLQSAKDKVNGALDSRANDICLKLKYNDQEWCFGGGNFAVKSSADNILEKVIKRGRAGKYYADESGLNIQYVFNGMEDKLEDVFLDIEKEPADAEIIFDPSRKEAFSITDHIVGVTVDRARLCDEILSGLKTQDVVEIDIPVILTEPEIKSEDLKKYTQKQATFSTDFSKSSSQRKDNIKLAFSKINGYRLEANEEFSFNNVVGERTAENGFKEAKVILGGEYENGIGGGICQASTTLYNAVIRAGLEVLEVHPHSLPASYVPLSLDAMVSWGYADFRFVNNSDGPIFIKTITDDNNIYATIYGNTLLDNQKVEPRAELVKTIPHLGDKIVEDTDGLYKDKIMFKGEYIRVSYPKEGYESKAYLDFYENGEKIESKEIRHDIYNARQGVVYEGAETLPEGMTLPANTVSIIPPQSNS